MAQGHLSRGVEGGESAVYSLPPPIPARPRLEPATFGLRVRLSTIRPRLSRLVYRIILLFVKVVSGKPAQWAGIAQ